METNPADSNLETTVNELRDELMSERIGRQIAEAKITELQGELRRANRAIVALLVDVDANPDIPDSL